MLEVPAVPACIATMFRLVGILRPVDWYLIIKARYSLVYPGTTLVLAGILCCILAQPGTVCYNLAEPHIDLCSLVLVKIKAGNVWYILVLLGRAWYNFVQHQTGLCSLAQPGTTRKLTVPACARYQCFLFFPPYKSKLKLLSPLITCLKKMKEVFFFEDGNYTRRSGTSCHCLPPFAPLVILKKIKIIISGAADALSAAFI